MTLDQLRERFADETACLEFFESVIWANGRMCPHCGHDRSYALRGKTSRPGTYECARCKKQFRVTTKTPMHSTKLPFGKWLQGMYFIANSSKGISSVVLGRWLGISQPAAWKMGHAIREMMAPCGQLNGIVELDEKYIGGNPRPHDGHRHKRGRGTDKQ
jgi:transposase-like protein